MLAETKKILDPKIKLTATCVRVPVFVGHSEAVTIEFEKPISAEEARANGRVAPFDPQGGLQSVGLAASATYSLTEDWALRAYGRYDHLVGDAARSPIVKRLGNPDQFTIGIGFTKSFNVNF